MMESMSPLRLLVREGDQFSIIHQTQDNSIEYDILSYRWGKEVPPWRSDIPGVSWDITLSDTKLNQVKKLMVTAEIECLWIDAICIDQTNEAEKSSEISKMYAYYSNAQKCHILLDLDDKWSSVDVVENMKRIGHVLQNMGGASMAAETKLSDSIKAFLVEWADKPWKFELAKSKTSSANIDLGLVNCYATCIHYITSLWDNDYFSRVWTFQEMVLGNNPTMWGVSGEEVTSIGDFDTWMNLAEIAHDKAESLYGWIDESWKIKPDSVNNALAYIDEDFDNLSLLQTQVKGIAAARLDISNGGSHWWHKNFKGIRNIFAAASFKPRQSKNASDVFRGLLGIFQGLFLPIEIETQLSGNDIDALTLTFFKRLSERTGVAWTKLAVSTAEREKWDFVPTTPATSSQLTTDCFSSVFFLGVLSRRNTHAHADATTSLEGTPRFIASLTFRKDTSAGSFRFIFRGCNCGKSVKTGVFKSKPIPLNDQSVDVTGPETGRVLIQCSTILSCLLNPGRDIVSYRARLLSGLDPRWHLVDRKNKPKNWIERCASGTEWAEPRESMLRVHNQSMNFRFTDMKECKSRLDNESTRDIVCNLRVNCGCQVTAPYSLIMRALMSVHGSSLGEKLYGSDEHDRIIIQDGLGLVQIGDDGRTFNLVAFGGDDDAHKAFASSCRSTRDRLPVEAKKAWPKGRALVREEFSHNLLDATRKYGYIGTGGIGNLLVCRNHPLDNYRILGVCIDESMESQEGVTSIKVK